MTNTREDLIAAVRNDKVVGRGSCSVIDEAHTDEELWRLIGGAKTPRGARVIARKVHNLNRLAEQEAVAVGGERL